MNGSFHINRGLKVARKLLLEIAEMGMPAAGEFLGGSKRFDSAHLRCHLATVPG
jgi:phospho-2-dehydro-3-deoxyheptonate aldolase